MGPLVQVSAPGENIQMVWAYADPTDGRHLITCGMFSDARTNSSYGYVYASSDGGATWRRTLFDNATRWVSEEACTFGNNGRAYFADGESPTSTGIPRHEWGHLQLFFSQDHGETWKPAGRREWVDWTMLVATPADKQHPEKLVIFGNLAADKEGHWFEQQPVALEATENAQKLSGLMPATVTSSGNFGAGTLAMPDQTALFLVGVTDPKYKSSPGLHRRVDLLAYSPSDHSLSVRATLQDVPGRTQALPTLARDPSERSHGRLYAAWDDTARTGSDAQLWLATSDDNGYHWSSRPILSIPDYKVVAGCPRNPFAREPDLRIAFSRSGTLGLLWMVNAQTIEFAQSRDEGKTFQVGSLVVNQPLGDLSVDDGVNFNEWSLSQYFANSRAEDTHKYNDRSHLGLSVRMSRHRAIGGFALTVDADDRFHAFWSAAGSDGAYALMTRSIDLPIAANATHIELTGTDVPSTCEADMENVKAEEPSEISAIVVSGQTDVSASLNLHVDHVEYSSESHIVTATVSLTNKESAPTLRPVSLVALGLHSDFGVATPLNADGMTQEKPFWNIASVAPDDDAKAIAKPIQLRFKIDQFHTVPRGDAVAMQIRIFANDAAQSTSSKLSP